MTPVSQDLEPPQNPGRFNRHRHSCQESRRDETTFTVLEPIVFEREGQSLENALGIDEVQAMLAQVSRTLRFVPSELRVTL